MESISRDPKVAALQRKLNLLVSRMDDGLPMIEDARSQGKNVSKWENAWIALLEEYEQVYDALQAVQA